jgi:hypothetical protein
MDNLQYNYDLFDETWLLNSRPELNECFEAFEPRSGFIRKSKTEKPLKLDSNESPNIVMRKTRFCSLTDNSIPEFSNVFCSSEKFELFEKKLVFLENYIAQYIINCKTSFITFSTNLTGAEKGLEHLHPLMNQDRCNVWSFAIPLFINKKSEKKHKFLFSYSPNLFPTRYYVDYARLKKDELNYSAFEIPTNGQVFSIQFDGARTAHYIDYTDHLYAWFVFDGVEYKENFKPSSQFQINLI